MEKCLYTIQTGDGKGESFKAPPPPKKKPFKVELFQNRWNYDGQT